jgi:O-acetyl-ADP-ribose deacetylase (regulator of RNase III)
VFLILSAQNDQKDPNVLKDLSVLVDLNALKDPKDLRDLNVQSVQNTPNIIVDQKFLSMVDATTGTNMVKQLNSDIFKAPINILVHQCNCFHTMGGGIAAKIKEKFPEAYTADQKTLQGDKLKMGTYSVASVKKPQPYIKYIVNLYGQYFIGNDVRQTDYEAVYRGLDLLKYNLTKNKMNSLIIGFPHGFGCGLGGGNWNIIEVMIQEIFDNYKTDVLICKLPSKEN